MYFLLSILTIPFDYWTEMEMEGLGERTREREIMGLRSGLWRMKNKGVKILGRRGLGAPEGLGKTEVVSGRHCSGSLISYKTN